MAVLYPWGNEFDAAKANTGEGQSLGRTSPVGMYPHGANEALELYDLSGNVWEWCRNKYEDADDTAVDSSGASRVVRGGSWDNHQYVARAAYRDAASIQATVRRCRFSGGGASSPISKWALITVLPAQR